MLTVSIVIPSLNSPIIDKVIDAILQQDKFEAVQEVVVVGKDDAHLLQPMKPVQFIETEKPILAAAARNRGIAASTGELLIFLDSDCLVQPGWLAEHMAAHEAGHCVVSGGILPEGENYWHLSYNLTLFHELLSTNSAEPKNFLATLNLSVDRVVIDQIGMMDETIDRVEDVDWTTRMRQAGIQPYFWPKAAVYHDHNRRTFKAVWRDCALSGFHMRQLRLRYSGWLQAPRILRNRFLVVLLSPFIAAWATLRILLRRRNILFQFPQTIPALFLTKVAWCWGAGQSKPPK
ncbi:MAG: glycosyltransferase [Candidatus Promineifilaceae bacterium]